MPFIFPHMVDEILPSGSILYALEEYSFSDDAARKVIARSSGVRIANVKDVQNVLEGAEREGPYAMVPFENSSGGVVWPHLDRLREIESRCYDY